MGLWFLVRTEAGGSAASRLLVLRPLSQQRAGGECKRTGEGAQGLSILQGVSWGAVLVSPAQQSDTAPSVLSVLPVQGQHSRVLVWSCSSSYS